jgi:hypothetical protein
MNAQLIRRFSVLVFFALTGAAFAQDEGTYAAVKQTMSIDGDLGDWAAISSDTLKHSFRADGSSAPLAVDIRWAWDDTYLYTLVRETSADDDPAEGEDRFDWTNDIAVELGSAKPWFTDSVGFYDVPGEASGINPTLDDQTGPWTNYWIGLSSDTDEDQIRFQARMYPEGADTDSLIGDDPGEEDGVGGEEIGMARNHVENGLRAVEFRLRWDQIRWDASDPEARGGHTLQDVGPGYTFRNDPLLVDGVDSFTYNGQAYPGGATNPNEVALRDVTFVRLVDSALLQPGDADQDYDFDQLDLVRVQVAAKYLSGQPATWGDGDWDGAPGGQQGSPPVGNGLFDQVDIIAALSAGKYLTGPYAALADSPAPGVGVASNQSSMIPVPEPSAVALLAIGLFVAGFHSGRRTGRQRNRSDQEVFRTRKCRARGTAHRDAVEDADRSERVSAMTRQLWKVAPLWCAVAGALMLATGVQAQVEREMFLQSYLNAEITVDGDTSDWDLGQFGTYVVGGVNTDIDHAFWQRETGTGDIARLGWDEQDENLFYAGKWTGAALPEDRTDHAVKVYARDNATHQYFLVEITDDEINMGDPDAWANDCVEFYFDPGNDGDPEDWNSDAQLVIDVDNQVQVWMSPTGYARQVEAGVNSAITMTETGWLAEVGIEKGVFDPPLPSILGSANDPDGASYGIDFMFRDNDDPDDLGNKGGDTFYSSAYTWADPFSGGGFPSKTADSWGGMIAGSGGAVPLQAGDADMDYDFDQLDLVQVQIAAKYLTGSPATWGEGDWNGAPGGQPGSPPQGNGLFDQIDIIAALTSGNYLTGPYNALASDLTVAGSLAGGGDWGDVNLAHVPEPSAVAMLLLGLAAMLATRRPRSR